MDQQEVEFQRFLQKLEFSDTVWKQLVAQKNLDLQDQCPEGEINPQFKFVGQQLNQGIPKNT
ncbi:MAG: hypothetical protein AB8B48_13630 [Pseudomonadales bacterium]